jgi:hypothetical protein
MVVSENSKKQILDNEERDDEQHNDQKSGLVVFDYVVPWWLVILVVLVVAYLIFDYKCGSTLKRTRQLRLVNAGPSISVLDTETPNEIKRLLRMK